MYAVYEGMERSNDQPPAWPLRRARSAAIASSLSGNCVVHSDNVPSYVIECDIRPSVVECMEMEEAE